MAKEDGDGGYDGVTQVLSFKMLDFQPKGSKFKESPSLSKSTLK